MISKTLLIILLILLPIIGHAGIYGYVDERGIYHFTNIIPAGKKYNVIIVEKRPSAVSSGNRYWKLNTADSNRYDTLIRHHSNNHGVDPTLVKAVMKAESNFNPHAVSNKGAQGLMQLMPDTARLMQISNPFDPSENIKAGTKYLKMLDEIFQGDLDLILAAYNAGPFRVIEYNMKVPPIEETKTFISRVKLYYNQLK
jgi:soluble lytic murein transglycosylase